MRYAFINVLRKLARQNKKIFLLTGDLGFTVFEEFAREFPDRFLNMGVAEANMVGVAAGLAQSGKIPFVYSIATFASMRPFEHIRNDVAAQNLNVKIVGVGAGLSYGSGGLTHHSTEDIGIMRTLPNMTILCPADPEEAGWATAVAAKHKGPIYLRLGKSGEPKVYDGNINFKIGVGVVLKEGKDVCLIATGNQVHNALLATKKLEDEGIMVKLISMGTLKPLDEDLLFQTLKKIKNFVTLEEHSIIGGLGSAVAEVLAEAGGESRLKRLGIKDKFTKIVGSHNYLRDHHAITPEKIAQAIKEFLK